MKMKTSLRFVAAAALLLFGFGVAAQEAALDKWPTARANNLASLQNGARVFSNYCLNCHAASLMRWNRLRDIGLTEEQIGMLIFGDQKVSDLMTISMNPKDAKAWFGKTPPDLSVIIRAKSTVEQDGRDYVYTFLRGFHRDRSTQTGWNNIAYPNTAMPNIFWERQGPREAVLTRVEEKEEKDDKGDTRRSYWEKSVSRYAADGSVTVDRTEQKSGPAGFEVQFKPADPAAAAAVDSDVADLVAFMNWMAEPDAQFRRKIGVWAVGFLVVFIGVARWLNAVYWKDVR
jgi:ubiquinol-cytochrome c reductase cytochrome c1 subunit